MLVRDGRIVTDSWTLVEDGPARPGVIAPFDAWKRSPQGAGVWVDGDREIEEVVPDILQAPVVAVRFPAYADGRGLTFGALLRGRYGFGGELRACGDVLADHTEYMRRCGFDAYQLADRRQAEVAIACMARMSDHYQASVAEPEPAFRRVAFGT